MQYKKLAAFALYEVSFSQLHKSKCQDNFRYYTYTHPLNGPFSGTTLVSRYQKGKTNLDFTEARDSEWQWHQLDHMQVCTSLQTDNHASTPLLSFYRPDALPATQPTASKHWRHLQLTKITHRLQLISVSLTHRYSCRHTHTCPHSTDCSAHGINNTMLPDIYLTH